jgi:phytoene dehydrogenase-like protein
MDYDVVVVGAGHNGLICAAYLARAGVRTLLVEARDSVGGCSSTVDAVGTRVNICNCDHVPIRSLPLREELDLDAHGLRYLDLDPVHIGLSWEGDGPAVLFHDAERTLEALAVTHPDQVEGYRRYLHDALPVARLVLDLAAHPGPPRAGPVARHLVRRHGAGAATLLRWSRASAAGVLRRYLSSETLLGSLLGTGPVVWGVSPHWAGTGLGALRAALLHTVQPGRPVGGSGALGDAIRASFEAAGGETRCSTKVSSLLVEGERLVGLRTVQGSEVRAGTVVVACDPRFALLEWLTDPPPTIAAMVERWRAKPSHDGYESKIDAVVGERPRYLELSDALLGRVGVDDALVPTTVIAPGVDRIAQAHRDGAAGRVATDPIMLVNVPSVADPTMTPAGGGHTFSLEVLYTPYALAGGWPGSTEPRRWLERYATKVQPGWLDSLGEWRAVTPDVYETEFSMPRGYAQSFAGGPLAALVGKDPELSRYRTPLAGLYLTGAATFPGAGVWGAPGRNAAHVLLADLDRAAAAGAGRSGGTATSTGSGRRRLVPARMGSR